MKANKMLVAVDESEGAKCALDMAAALAEPNPEAQLDLVYVVPIPLLDEAQTESFREVLDMMIADGKEIITDMKDSLGESIADRTDTLLLTGVNPATEILKLIEQGDYDLVVMGNRGLSGFKEYMGSVSLKVLNGSTIPVFVVK
ncbi:MAG: universal stress protein [Gordonibacter sp.]|uniref:universal stress protein n=1 Tax=Gordonibacter sp. TaxID=1968902 RepID=UPI002FC96AB6